MVCLQSCFTILDSEVIATMVAEPIIQVRNLTMAYGDNVILHDISFDVFPGQTFVILGGSGCGKSTLMKHIIGLYKPAEGKSP